MSIEPYVSYLTPHTVYTVDANQWMVVDLTRFRSGKAPLHGLLTVLEEIPGYMHSADLTSHLVEKGYWASYNNPFFDDISVLSGNADICESNRNTCYDTDPRALLFQKHHSSVYDLTDMQRILGLNEYATESISLNDSCNVRTIQYYTV
jgi:Phospholipase B